MGTSVSMVIPSSGSERAESREPRAGKRPSFAAAYSTTTTRGSRNLLRRLPDRQTDIRAQLDENPAFEILHARQRHFSTPLISSEDRIPRSYRPVAFDKLSSPCSFLHELLEEPRFSSVLEVCLRRHGGNGDLARVRFAQSRRNSTLARARDN